MVPAVDHDEDAPGLVRRRARQRQNGLQLRGVIADDVEGIEAPREGGGLAQLVRGDRHRVQDIVEAAVGKELRLGERRYRDPAPRAARLQRPELQRFVRFHVRPQRAAEGVGPRLHPRNVGGRDVQPQHQRRRAQVANRLRRGRRRPSGAAVGGQQVAVDLPDAARGGLRHGQGTEPEPQEGDGEGVAGAGVGAGARLSRRQDNPTPQ